MSNIFPKGCSKEDSSLLAKLYIDNWIKTRLLLKRAELNLSTDQSDISEEIETYRTSLLIYKYEDRLLRDKLDTVVFESEIRDYYETNIANFLAEEHLVKAIYIKLPVDAPSLWNVRRWYRSNSEQAAQDLSDYCQRYAIKYDLFNDEWISWARIEEELPQKEAAKRQMTLYSSVDEQKDDNYIYMVRIKEKIAPGNTAPLEFVTDKVRSIIINKRKLKFLSELKRNIYDDALAKNQFEIYKIN